MKRGDILQEIPIQELTPSGQGKGRYGERDVFVWDALPGEGVDIRVLKKKRGMCEGIVVQRNSISPQRIVPQEDHFLSCSPWQGFDFEEEKRLKEKIVATAYSQMCDNELLQTLSLVSLDQHYGYRNKMEFSFCEREGDLSLAFFERGYKHKLIPFQSCRLASDSITAASQHILAWLQKEKVKASSLKSFIVRSNKTGGVIAALYIKDHVSFFSYPQIDTVLHGFHIYFSDPKSPASLPTELVYSEGQSYLSEVILDTQITFGMNCFFQVNIPVFELALLDIAIYIKEFPRVVDLFSGVGSISIPLASHNDFACVLVEENKEAIEYARKNGSENKRENFEYRLARVEQCEDSMLEDACVLLDPPRSGVHPKVIKMLQNKKPRRIIYLSCNIQTQARDLELLQEQYKPIFVRVYNFFPRTPHIEGLCVLDLRY